MAKILLVEDDKSLREIYGVRLLAEGYDIVSAGDGEEALAMAIKERPQLILSDVMMPKISGFDMLDILRSTTETKDIKIIMMTALSSEEQRARGVSLGADRYLVKSQVGIEDVVKTVHDVLSDTTPAAEKQPDADASIPAAIYDPETPSNENLTDLEPMTSLPTEPQAITGHDSAAISAGVAETTDTVQNPLVAADIPDSTLEMPPQVTPVSPSDMTTGGSPSPAPNTLANRVIEPLPTPDDNNVAERLTQELEAKMPPIIPTEQPAPPAPVPNAPPQTPPTNP